MTRASSRAIVVVAYGRPDLLDAALAALDPGEHVVVVDNSRQSEVREVAHRHDATYLDAGHNRGFAGGVNLAVDHLTETGRLGDVLLLNPDARIASSAIDELQQALADDPSLAAVSPALTGTDGQPQRVTWPFPSPAGMWREAVGRGRNNDARPDFVVGAVLLLRAEALRQVGAFDERFFLYAEEADWQRRAAQLGWRSAVVAAVPAEHVGAATSTDASARNDRFHAAQETYVRRWHGAGGWASYRLAALAGAGARAAVLRGPRRRDALDRARLYLRGPARAAALPPPGRPLRITHVVVTANVAGTERHVLDLACAQAGAGHDVTVIGGDPARMPGLLGHDVRWVPGADVRSALRAVRAGGPRDIVNTHLSSADLVGTLTGPWHGARVVSTRHMATTRGSSPVARAVLAVCQRRIDAEICVSEFVRAATGRPATVVHNGVADDSRTPESCAKRVIVAQRLDPEKATAVALDGWRRSGLAQRGWTLVIAGAGAQRLELEADAPAGVQWLGWVDDLRGEFLRCAALLAPAAAEPYGLAVVEAMSVALPVLAAAGGGHLETVGRIRDAMLFTVGDAEDCARVLRAFADRTAGERRSYGRRLRERQRDELSVRQAANKIELVYRAQ